MAASRRLHIEPGEGESAWLAGYWADFKISGEETGGAFSVLEHRVDPGLLVVPHMHTREDEFSFVLEGRIGARVGDRIIEAGAGSYVFKPRGSPHTFWNAWPEPARFVEIIAPPGFERFFADAAPHFDAEGGPDFAALTELADRYGTKADWWDWVPELVATYPALTIGAPQVLGALPQSQ